MLRITFTTLTKPTLLPSSTRAITTSAVRMGAGDTGAPRAGGAAQGDAFTKREQASEDYAIRQREIEKLKALKEKVAAHKQHLDELDKNIDEDMKKQ